MKNLPVITTRLTNNVNKSVVGKGCCLTKNCFKPSVVLLLLLLLFCSEDVVVRKLINKYFCIREGPFPWPTW